MKHNTGKHAKEIEQRVRDEAHYIITHKSTVRETCKHFGVCKSTVFSDMTKRLPNISAIMYEEIKNILNTNASIRHLHGGEATRIKYLKVN